MRCKKALLNAKLGVAIAIFLGILAGNHPAFAQAQRIKWLRVGALHSWYSNWGAEIELGRVPGDLTLQQDGLRWPADFLYQDTEVAKAMWLGAVDYFDPRVNQTFPHKVIGVGPRQINVDIFGETFPQDFRMVGRFRSPTVLVDDNVGSINTFDDIVDEVDPGLLADRVIFNTVHTAIGVTVSRKLMAFAQQNHDNYFIYEYVFKNTGIIDNQGTVDTKTINGFIAQFQYRYAAGKEAFQLGWAPTNNITWGRNTVHEVVGQDPNAANFEFRALYSFYGPHSLSPVDSWGAPNPNDGRLGAVQFMGVVVLHADKSATDKSDDPFQPTTTMYLSADRGEYPGSTTNFLGPSSNQFNAALMSAKYGAMSAGHPARTHAQEIANGFADTFGNDLGGFQQTQGFGPYDLAPGDSIRIVVAEAVAGISRQKSLEVGRTWFENTGPFVLPDGSAASNRDEYKRLWVQTGRDSLFQTFRRAIANFKSNYNIPKPPPPPNVFEVRSGGDRIVLTWSDNAESFPNFQGYRIYRAEARPDTFYTQIFETRVPNIVNRYDDTTARRGFNYYYYIESFDDGSTNDVHPNTPLASSRFFTMTSEPAFLRRPAETSLARIRIVPNPFHLRALDLQFGRLEQGRISFFGLPPECIIKIYTERGDLIATLDHNNGTGDELWNSVTSSGQIIVSGVYIAYFEVPRDLHDLETGELLFRKGEHTFRKFIVIR